MPMTHSKIDSGIKEPFETDTPSIGEEIQEENGGGGKGKRSITRDI